MGLLGNLIMKGVTTAARNSTIKAAGYALVEVMEAKAKRDENTSETKKEVLQIKPTRSCNEYYDENVSDILKELLGVGFDNVTLKAEKKLKERTAKKYGKISSISINGKRDFSKMKKVPSSSHIVIEFLDFKDDIGEEVYTGTRRIMEGTFHSLAEIEKETNACISVSGYARYCIYCGQPISDEKARFCSHCGKEV